MDLLLAVIIASAGLKTEVSAKHAGVVYDTAKVKMPSGLLTYVVDELNSDYITMTDIDPKAFEFQPDTASKDEKSADFQSIKFISMLLYPDKSDPIALNEPLLPANRKSDMYFIEGIPSKNAPTVYNSTAKTQNYPTSDTEHPQKSFYIDMRPISNREYREFVNATGHNKPVHWNGDMVPLNQKDDPVVNVSWVDATAYAAWAKRRLPTYEEYQRAIKRFPDIRLNAPLREITSTPDSEGTYKTIGGDPVKGKQVDQQMGFRTVKDI